MKIVFRTEGTVVFYYYFFFPPKNFAVYKRVCKREIKGSKPVVLLRRNTDAIITVLAFIFRVCELYRTNVVCSGYRGIIIYNID